MESGNQRGKYRRRVVCKYHFMNDLLGSDDSRCLTSHHFRDCGRSERLVIRGRRRELGLGAVALPSPSGSASPRCWSGPSQWPCETTTRATGRTGRRARGMAFWRTAGELEVANRLVEGVLIRLAASVRATMMPGTCMMSSWKRAAFSRLICSSSGSSLRASSATRGVGPGHSGTCSSSPPARGRTSGGTSWSRGADPRCGSRGPRPPRSAGSDCGRADHRRVPCRRRR